MPVPSIVRLSTTARSEINGTLGRRSLVPFQRAELALIAKPLIAERAKENQGARTDISQKSVKSVDTQKELAKVAGVSHDTIAKKWTQKSLAVALGVARETIRDWMDATNGESANGYTPQSKPDARVKLTPTLFG